jgi:zona occludens toxin
MLTLITGTPGAGKTAWTVQELTRLPSQRKIYVHGIPELKIAHESIYCVSDLCEHCRSLTVLSDDQTAFELRSAPGIPVPLVETWPEWVTEGSLIVVDEVQRVWRPSGSKVPDEIAALETHRHKGYDFWLISQGPHLFHSNIRLLIARHIHLVSTWRGRNEYEFSECRQNVTSRSDAVVRPYTLPKKVFGLYKSASLHTKVNHRKPLSFYFLLATLFIIAILGYTAYQRYDARVNPKPEQASEAAGGAGAQAVATPAASKPVNENKESSGFPDFKPVIEGVPESAPAYSHLIKVTAAPVLAGCLRSEKAGCKCFTNQATPYHTTDLYCNEVVDGHRFNPYVQITHENQENEDTERSQGQDEKKF